jgi:predicted nuclease of restriction endonuclease-like (RecB) superfamily
MISPAWMPTRLRPVWIAANQILKEAFPKVSGFSPRNPKYMRKFAAEWPELAIVQEVLAQISWYHNLALLEKIKDEKTRIWYARQAKINGWSRNILTLQMMYIKR